jgi:predicted alpha-1,6-mannanase (GH76 family)
MPLLLKSPQFLTRSVAAFLLCMLLYRAPAASASDDALAPRVQLAAERLQQWYQPDTGLWKSTGWWNSANALTAIIDYSRVTRSTEYQDVIVQTFAQGTHHDFLNEFYDDEGWWALAWIDAYDLTGKEIYLSTAESIFDDMAGGWDDTCGGGIWWKKDRHYKNAIANELFLDVAAHLANRSADKTKQARYLEWGNKEWKWFEHSTMITPEFQINDGLDANCKNNHGTVWSYNQGVILGGLAELSRQPGNSKLVNEAQRIADAAIHHLADANGVLHDPCEPNCGEDGTQFKGIFVRNLAILEQRKHKRQYVQFIRTNAESLLRKNENADHSFGVVWSGPPGATNASAQSSALDALVAALVTHAERHK